MPASSLLDSCLLVHNHTASCGWDYPSKLLVAQIPHDTMDMIGNQNIRNTDKQFLWYKFQFLKILLKTIFKLSKHTFLVTSVCIWYVFSNVDLNRKNKYINKRKVNKKQEKSK